MACVPALCLSAVSPQRPFRLRAAGGAVGRGGSAAERGVPGWPRQVPAGSELRRLECGLLQQLAQDRTVPTEEELRRACHQDGRIGRREFI